MNKVRMRVLTKPPKDTKKKKKSPKDKVHTLSTDIS